MLKYFKKNQKTLLVHLCMSIVTLIIIFPIIFMVVKATQTNHDALTPSLRPGGMLWENLQLAWKGYDLNRYMLNTLVISTAITIGKTVLSLFAAMVLVYFHIPKKALIFWFILFTLYIPTDLVAIGLFDLVSKTNPTFIEFISWILRPDKVLFSPVPFGFGWTNTYLSVIVPFLASATGTFLFVQHFKSIPRTFAEVAYIEGMTSIQYMFKILIPISLNTIGALWVIQFIAHWNQYFWPRIIIRNNDAQVVQVAIRNIFFGDQIEWAVLMAAALIIVIPPVIIFLLLIKQLKSGITLSSGY